LNEKLKEKISQGIQYADFLFIWKFTCCISFVDSC